MRAAVLVIALALAGCGSTQSGGVNPTPQAFNPADAEFIRRPGSATIRGQMFLRRNDGMVVYGAGSDAILMPRTPYSEQAIAKSFGGGKLRMEVRMFGTNLLGNELNLDPAFTAYFRRIKADGQGNFVFEGVPPGRYYVLGRVTWCITQRYGSCDLQGGDLLEAVTISPTDKVVQAIMSGA